MTALHIAAAGLALLAASGTARADRERTLDHRSTVRPGQSVEIKGLRGSEIEFRTWDEPAVRVQLVVSASSSDEEWEERYVNAVKLKVDSSSERLTITYREPDEHESGGSWLKRLFNFRWYRKMNVSGVVYVPRANAFTTDLRYGEVSLDGMEGEVRLNGQSNTVRVRNCPRVMEIENDYGWTTVERSGGDVRIEAKNGELTIADFRGSVDASAEYAKAVVSGVVGKVVLKGKSGTVRVADVQGDVDVDADYSRVTVERVAGFVNVSNKSGAVDVRTVEGVGVQAPYSEVDIEDVSGKRGSAINIRSTSGRLNLSRAAGNVWIENPYSTIELTDIKGNVECRAQSSNIKASRIQGDWKSDLGYTRLEVRELKANEVTVSNTSGEVELDLVSAPARLQVRNAYANVSITVPRQLAAKVRLKSEYGDVRSDLPLEVERFNTGALATGTVGGGTGTFTVDVKSGDARVRWR